MIDLEFWFSPSEHSKEFAAAYWTTQNILVPIAERELSYKGFVYELDNEDYSALEKLRTERGYSKNFCGKCKNKIDALNINGFFIGQLRSIKGEIDKCIEKNIEPNIKKVRPI